MMNPLIIKLGGVLLDSEEALERLFSALVNYRESHQRPLVIVHGGGCVVDELMKGLNLPVKKKNGLRGGVFHLLQPGSDICRRYLLTPAADIRRHLRQMSGEETSDCGRRFVSR